MLDYRVMGISRPFIIQIAGQHIAGYPLFYHPLSCRTFGIELRYQTRFACYCRKRALILDSCARIYIFVTRVSTRMHVCVSHVFWHFLCDRFIYLFIYLFTEIQTRIENRF